MQLEIVYLPVGSLKPYEKNTRKHGAADVEKIAESIRRYGFSDPVGVWGEDNLIVEGHGRWMAAQSLGLEAVPCVRLDHLTVKERREYAIAHNRTAELSAWDAPMLAAELPGLDLSTFSFAAPVMATAEAEAPKPDNAPEQTAHFWGETQGQTTDEYREFTEKFQPKLTTDDCYTPPLVYEAVKDWAVGYYGLGDRKILRPFYPGGDYQTADYPEKCVVIDNPPFSIISEIVRWYMNAGIDFLLFAPALSLFSCASGEARYLPVGVNVTYENGAVVCTSFVTSLGPWKIDTEPSLWEAVTTANKRSLADNAPAELPKYQYPREVITAPTIMRFCKGGANIKIREATFVRKLDSQKDEDKAIFGGGFLISHKAAEKAAAEKAAAEKAAAEKAAVYWPLSDAEQAAVAALDAAEAAAQPMTEGGNGG